CQITFLLCFLFCQDVTFISTLSCNFTCSSQFETFFRAGIGFYFWHNEINIISICYILFIFFEPPSEQALKTSVFPLVSAINQLSRNHLRPAQNVTTRSHLAP